MLTPLLLTCALANPHPTDMARGGCGLGRAIGIGIGVGVGVEVGRAMFAPRHCDAYYAEPVYYRDPYYCSPRTVYVDRPVYVQRPVYVEQQPVVVERPVYTPPTYVAPAQPAYVAPPPPVTIQRVIERERVVQPDGQSTTYEKADGTLTRITHGSPAPASLDGNAEMAALCNIRDEINKLSPLSLANIITTGSVRQVEVTLRATRFAPYDRVTRRFSVNVNQLTAVGSGLTIRFNNTPQGIKELAGDMKAQLKALGDDCAKVGGNWYMDDQFQAEPKMENGKKLTDVVAGL